MKANALPARILIADDHPIIIVALAEMLKTALGQGRVLVDSVTDSDSLLSRLQAESWEYLVLDLRMPGRLNSAPLLQAILAAQPSLQVVIYTGEEHPCLAQALLDLGARAFVSKASGPQVAIDAIGAVVAGNSYVDPLVDLDIARKHPWHQLTTGERTVMIALARGENLQAIAIDSNRSYKTVTTHKYNALRKLGLRSKDELGHYLEQHGLDYLL
ncbi:response regulator transcription factor [Lysobacter antibioticus]|uniref:response regulator transcription factor n=1 Tax=Lysobacter antibioticus TaxID=84531 RepID=UPI000689981F|nr:response regulator transcription factor [Lysobacter antibioticus]